MTPADFSSALSRLALSQSGAAAVLGVSDRALRMWISGDRAVPEPVAKLMRLMVAGKVSPDDVRAAGKGS